MIDHFGILSADFGKAKEFYDSVLRVLDYERQMDVGPAVGYGTAGKPDFWIEDAGDRPVGAPLHFAFSAPSPESVQAFYHAALALGAEPLHEPRIFDEYHPNYYGAFVRDPDGNNVEAVFHGGAPAPTDGDGGAPTPTDGDGGGPKG
ncbi:VOC family protein [Mycolicibacterium sp. GCM10028919]|uniref:VOC family protein n=1 Tax=Mycolicibacterium sp. GCM10028919 TaxID=3273401 RepID=UPI0036176F5E